MVLIICSGAECKSDKCHVVSNSKNPPFMENKMAAEISLFIFAEINLNPTWRFHSISVILIKVLNPNSMCAT